ncbi:MAG: glycosyltransferase [Lachnospiraceae bacterium]|nr:glycosyltransferase [Lachnospiraceae bacterium]
MVNKEKNFISAVVYVHNVQEWVGQFLGMLMGILERNFEYSEIICVNDASTDGSVDEIRKASREAAASNVSVLNMSYFHGLETAMNAGMDLTIGDFVFEFDSVVRDFDEAEVMGVYRRSLEGYDIVSTSPDKRERLSSRIFYKVFDCFTDLSYQLSTERFRILSRRVINRISSMNKTIPYRKAVYASCGLKTDHMKYVPREGREDYRTDKKEKNYRTGLAMDLLILFTEVGYRFSLVMTMLMMLMSVFMVIYSLVIYLTSHPIEGWTTTILFLSFAFLGLFGILTVIIKYLQLLVNLVFKRKQYSFESIEKITK